jgi:OmpA-OmpF porin, OOP family
LLHIVENSGENRMKKYLLLSGMVAALAAPASARDGAGYVGLEGGILFPRPTHFNAVITTTPATTTTTYDSAFVAHYNTGYDLDAVAGYDFGMFRLEGELGYKRTKIKYFSFDPTLLAALGEPAGTTATPLDFDISDHASVFSGMVNGLVDVGIGPSASLYAGGGVGRARVNAFEGHDSAWAWQLIAGVSTAVSRNVDLGLKYRYFQTGKVGDAVDDIDGNGTNVSLRGNFRSHSVLASLMFNLGGAAVAPPPPPPAAPAPPPPPATQTCPDGSVIDATETCPPPPPPPPPPAPRGERG